MVFRARIEIAAAIAAVACVLMIPVAAGAQSIPSGTFTLALSPQYPQPYSNAIVTPETSGLDFSNVTMVASVDGSQVYQGDVSSFPVTLGASGQLTTIKVVMSSGGQPYIQTLSIRPQDVSIVAEPQASVPPLYPGRPLVPLSGNVRVVAAANFKGASGARIDPSSLSYTWTAYGSTLSAQSGVGKNFLIAPVPLQYRSGDISVVVQTADGSLIGSAGLTLDPQEPSVRIYGEDPLLGILFDHALGNTFSIPTSEASFYGVPYSFSIAGGLPSLDWFVNGAHAQSGNVVTLRPNGQGQGSANLSFSASKNTTYESANTALELSFGSGAGNNLFGL